jgi:hypothetical protein
MSKYEAPPTMKHKQYWRKKERVQMHIVSQIYKLQTQKQKKLQTTSNLQPQRTSKHT